MPSTFNGVGTKYYGQRNLRTYTGTCDSCHRTAEMKDYETTYFFVVLYIPLIPLGKKQMLADCSVCRRHRVLSLAEWEKVRESSIAQGTQTLAENQDDPQAALKLLETLSFFSRFDEADRLAQGIQQRFDDDAEVQARLGQWHDFRKRPSDAAACYNAAHELQPDNVIARCGVARELILAERPEEAQSLLEAAPAITAREDPETFLALGTAYQQQGRHDAALETFRQVLVAAPKLGRDGGFRRLVRTSEKEQPGAASALPRLSQFQTRMAWVAAAGILVLAGLLYVNMHISRNRTLHLVNGFDVPVTVKLDDLAPVTIAPHSRVPSAVAEGHHRAVVTADGKPLANDEFDLATGFVGRWFDKPVFVYNAAGGAAILWEETTYAERPVDDGSTKLALGGPLLVFDDVDFAFEDFPPTIQLKNGRSVKRSRVSMAEMQPDYALLLPEELASRDQQLGYAEAHLTLTPDAKAVLQAYATSALSYQQADRARQFLERGLDVLPVNIEWHRVAQHLASTPEQQELLRKRYLKILQADPNNGAVLYLLGRLEPSTSAALTLYDRAIAADPDNAYAWNAKGYLLRADGNFADAKTASQHAVKLLPDDPDMRRGWDDVRFALGEFAELESEIRAAQQDKPNDFDLHARLLSVLAAQGKQADARELNEVYVARMSSDQDSGVFGRQAANYAQAIMHYLDQDFAGLLRDAELAERPDVAAACRYQANLELGKLDECASAVTAYPGLPDLFMDLRLSIAWRMQGDEMRARELQEKACAALEKGDEEARRTAALLRNAVQVSWVDVQDVPLEPQHKVVVLIALAQQSAERRSELLSLAEKLNYERSFSYHFNTRAIQSLRRQLATD